MRAVARCADVRAAESFRRLGDATNAANADYNRADVLVRQGRSDEALPLLQNTLRVARAVGDEELVALVLKEQAAPEAGPATCKQGCYCFKKRALSWPNPRTTGGSGRRHRVCRGALVGGSPETALTLIGRALLDAATIHAATLLPSAYRVQAAALLAMGEVVQAQTALAEGLQQSSSPDVAHERVSCLQSPPE